MSKLILGIDYSMSCPGVCICRLDENDDFKFENCDFIYATTESWKGKEYLGGQIIGHANFNASYNNMDRYIHLSNVTLDLIDNVYERGDTISCAIEEYAFSMSGQLASLGENAGILKYRLYEEHSEYVSAYSSLSIKAFARLALPKEQQTFIDSKTLKPKKLKMTKEEMHSAFVADTGVDLCKVFGVVTVLTKSGQPVKKNPIPDIVDSYWVAKYHYDQLKKR